jgi:hypothetical protein
MSFSRHRGWLRFTALVLLVAFGVTFGMPVLAADKVVPNKTLVIFPPDNPGNVNQSLLTSFADSIKAQAHASGEYQVVEFSPHIASIARALTEQRLTDEDVRAPYDTTKATLLAKEMSADVFLVSSVEQYTYDKEKNTVSILLVGQLGDPKTGKLTATSTVTGTATDAVGGRNEDQLTTLAAIDAVNQLAKGLFPMAGVVVVKEKKKNKNLLWVVLGVAAAVAISNSNSGGGGGSDDGPPPPP